MTDVLQHTFYCARSGLPFLVEFSKEKHSSQFLITRISKIVESSGDGSGSGVATSTIDPQKVNFSSFCCPHCNNSHEFTFVHCGKCGKDVCMGATSRDVWMCTAECGQSSLLSRIGLIKSHTFAKAEPASRAQRHLKQAITPTLGSLFSRQKSSSRELAKLETPKQQSPSNLIRRKGQ